jgi:hypothetical protein
MSQIFGPGPARIAWGYREAASLGAWKITITRDEATGSFSRSLAAELRGEKLDLHALRQRSGLTFVVLRDGRPLTWPIVSLNLGLAAITAELGAKEGSDHGVVAIRAS